MENVNMEDKIVLCLRDRTNQAGPTKMLVDIHANTDFTEDKDIIGDAISEFTTKAQKIPLKDMPQKVDIYIGYWAEQAFFAIPEELSKLASKLKAPIYIDFND